MSTDGSKVKQRERLLGAAVETVVPEDNFTRYLGGSNLPGLLAALVVATLFSADSLGHTALGAGAPCQGPRHGWPMARVMGGRR
jgi:uncharacterized membrane protein YraQ (UPF0718 family)